MFSTIPGGVVGADQQREERKVETVMIDTSGNKTVREEPVQRLYGRGDKLSDLNSSSAQKDA